MSLRKKWRLVFLAVSSFAIAGIALAFSYDEKTGKPKVTGQDLLQTVMLENFETPNSWVVKFSRARTSAWKENKPEVEPSEKWIHWKQIDKENYATLAKPEPVGREGEKGMTIMGIRGRFHNKGYNWISAEPKQDLYMMGKLLRLRVWVWGGNYDYDLYAVVKNFKNQFFKLHMGSLKFIGWKQLEYSFVNAPIPQTDVWAPQMKPIQFVRFLIMSKVTEWPDKFGIWFDDFQYDANLYDPSYYGKALEKELDWE